MRIVHSSEPGFCEFWERGTHGFQGATILYTSQFRAYEKLVFAERIVRDDSFVAVSSSKEVHAVVPLYAFKKDDLRLDYRYGNEYLRGPLFSKPPGTKVFNKTSKLVFRHIEELSLEKKICSHMTMIEPIELIEGRHYYNYLLDFGYEDESSVANVLVCHKPENELWLNLRKSYKPLINRARREYTCLQIHKKNYSLDLCEEYRKLHAAAAGRVTRNIASFHAMHEMVGNGQAFIVLVQESSGKTVGAYYFFLNAPYALYGSAATDPSLGNDSGVGHLGVWEGILYARKLGCKYLDLGQLLIRPGITEKEKNIDFFKQGFGAKRVTVFRGTRKFQ